MRPGAVVFKLALAMLALAAWALFLAHVATPWSNPRHVAVTGQIPHDR
jgi:hypothetical protein